MVHFHSFKTIMYFPAKIPSDWYSTRVRRGERPTFMSPATGITPTDAKPNASIEARDLTERETTILDDVNVLNPKLLDSH